MSSANLVRVVAIPEVVYGQTPAAPATALTARFTSEALTGTPTTAESAELRTDRMSGGQIITGLASGGPISFELSRDPFFDEVFMQAMCDATWSTPVVFTALTIGFTKDGANNQMASITSPTLDTGNFGGSGPLKVGDVLNLSGFATAANNGPCKVVAITDATHVKVTARTAAATEAAGANVTMAVPAFLDIGKDVVSVTLGKDYTDVTHLATANIHGQTYKGAVISELEISLAYGEVVKGTATYMANGYTQDLPSLAQALVTGGGTITPAGTTQPLNASVDVSMVTVDGQPTNYCIESLSFTLNNGLTPQNCIGLLAPTKYALGTADISITAKIYLSDSSYDAFMAKKLSQAAISLFMAGANADGGYGFQFTALQLTFPDPSAGGANEQVSIEAAGKGKVGPAGASSLRVYRF